MGIRDSILEDMLQRLSSAVTKVPYIDKRMFLEFLMRATDLFARDIEELNTSGAAGTVPVSDGAGNLNMGAAPVGLHAITHEDGGVDEIDVTDLAGLLADPQTPLAHAASHSDGGTDEISVENLATASAVAGQVPTADGAGGLSMLTPAGAWSADQVYFVGKHGDDAASGRSFSYAKETIASAISAAVAQGPSSTNRFKVCVIDAGIYAENITLPSWVSLWAPAARIEGTITLNDNVDCKVREVYKVTSGFAVSKLSGSGTSRFEADRVEVTGTAIAALNVGVGSVLMYEVKQTYLENGFGIGDASSAQGHVHVKCEDIYIQGTGTAIARFSTGTTEGYVAHILETGGGVGNGTGLNVGAGGGSMELVIARLAATTAYVIAVGSTLNAFIGELSGTKTVNGTEHVSVAGAHIEALTTAGPAGTVPVSDGAGGLTMSVPGAELVNVTDTGVAEGNNSITGFEDKVLLKRVRVETSALSWTLTVYARDDYTTDPKAILVRREGDYEAWLDLTYEDEDGTQEFHYNFTDHLGSNTHDIEVWGVRLT